MKKALVELLKSFARFMYFGGLGLVSTFLVSLATNTDVMNTVWTFQGFSLQVGSWIVLGAGFVAKAIDLYVKKNKNVPLNGIAPKFLQR